MADPSTRSQAASFRDPGGRLFWCQDRIFRALNSAGEASLLKTLESPTAKAFLNARDIVSTRFLDADEAQAVLSNPDVARQTEDMDCSALVEHEAAPFPNYPHEWSPEMLHAAGSLTIQLASAFLTDGIGLKDATPSNVMFWGAKPVFLDMLSFEERDAHDPMWLPDAQFVRTFLLPLLVNRQLGMPLSQTFTTRRDGLEPEEVYRLLGPLERIRPRSLSLVSLPVWLGKRNTDDPRVYHQRKLKDAEQARFILNSLFRRQKRALDRLSPPLARGSVWSSYMEGNNNYSSAQSDAKLDFVRGCLSEVLPREVLDIGCNTGVFSLVAAKQGARVVAVDYDPVVADRVWRMAKENNASILPLVVNLARPTPAVGWLNAECRSFLDRAESAFDTVLMLAVVHHLLVTERIPLAQIFQTAQRLTRRWLIVEYVGPSDSMFIRLTRGRSHLHQDFNRETFEQTSQKYFRIVRSEPLPNSDRILYLMANN
jgi:SAM-dependent methyltransferase